MSRKLQLKAKPLSSTPLSVGGTVQSKSACRQHTIAGGACASSGEHQPQLRPIAREAPAAVPEVVDEVVRSAGQPLDPATRAFMEPRLGHDFSAVRVHTDAKAAASAHAVEAQAYTMGSDIVFSAGQYAPRNDEGRFLLAHELTHVIQQRGDRRLAAPTGCSSVLNDRNLEIEADRLAARALHGGVSADLPKPPTSVANSRPGEKGTIVLQRQGHPAPASKIHPTRRAYDFEPDHVFYELLAHEISYEGGVAGNYRFEKMLDKVYLYRAYQSYRPETPKPALTPAAAGLPSLPGLPGITSGVPAGLEDNFAFMSSQPEIPPPIPYVGGGPTPLYYQVFLMEGSDPSDTGKGEGLTAYYLVPVPPRSSVPKILVFRGTEPSVADIRQDANQAGIGASAFAFHRPQIQKTLKYLRSTPGKTVVVGHSLGGALGQRATAAFPSLVDELVTFNSPGVGKQAVTELETESSKNKNGPAPKISYYVTRGDIVSTAGGRRLPGTVTMLEGNATKELEEMLDNGGLKRIESWLFTLFKTVLVLADGQSAAMSFASAVDTLVSLFTSGAFWELKSLGELMGMLHGQRLLRASQIGPADLAPGAGPMVTKEWKPLASDVRELASASGKVTRTKKTADELSIPENERARSYLGGGSFGQDLDLLFKLIQEVKKNLKLLQEGVVLNTLMDKMESVLLKLLVAVFSAGGLEALIKSALYRKPVTSLKESTGSTWKEESESLKQVPDALRFVKHIRGVAPR